jgi:hypothetical protein
LRCSLRLSLTALLTILAVAAVGVARAAQAVRPGLDPVQVRRVRSAIDHYRLLAWTYQQAAHRRHTPTTYAYRRSTNGAYLQWTLAAWQGRADTARHVAITSLRRRLDVRMPAAPGRHASVARRLRYARTVAVDLHRIYPGGRAGLRTPPHATATEALELWQERAADAVLAVSRHATRLMSIGTPSLRSAFMCIHRYEGAWNANTGNGYYGGLQMNVGFMERYGSGFLERWGTADHWPPWAQLEASVRAYLAGRGFAPWPNTAAACGLL